MQRLHGRKGFTLIELMVVVGIIAVLAAVTAPRFTRFITREEVRSNAQEIARILAEARSRAKDTGLSHFVIFSSPMVFRVPGVDGAPQTAQVVRDIDGNWSLGPADRSDLLHAVPYTNANVTGYGAGPAAPWGDATLPAEDVGAATRGFQTLDDVAAGNGSTFPNAPFNFNPTVGFTPQGIPVDLNTPTVPGSGSGAFYLTDNHHAVYAVILLPLGGVRVRTLDAGANPMVWR